jgi:hypothetical protein
MLQYLSEYKCRPAFLQKALGLTFSLLKKAISFALTNIDGL